MTPRACQFRRALAPAAVALLGAALAPGALAAQYKVIGADGKVTYTDREPNTTEGKVSALGARAQAQAPEPELPFELRTVASRYPVTLYTASGACEPCNSARQLLKSRGVPFSERQVVTAEDSDALESLSGAREAPTLTIGSQTLRGLANDVWSSYLDAAGYPRQSLLPSNYQYRPATPIVERRETAATRTGAGTPPQTVARPAAGPPPTPGGIRF